MYINIVSKFKVDNLKYLILKKNILEDYDWENLDLIFREAG